MATYKVIQDIEAEDKLLGPLTLRQFIYGAVAGLCGYFCFLGVAKHFYPLLIIFLPIMLLFGFFAFPWGRDQPTEVWALAKVRFMLLPRRRIWDQSGAKELVTVTAPKKIDQNYTNNLSQTEVKSRLQALADTLDSRGWVTKNINPADVPLIRAAAPQSDRLVDIASLPHEVASINLQPQDDILDDSSQTSANFSQMINAAETNHHQQLLDQMQHPGQVPQQSPSAPPDNFWFLNQSSTASPASDNVIIPGSQAVTTNIDENDIALAEQIKANKKAPQIASTHLKTIQPLSGQIPTAPLTPLVSSSINTDIAPPPKADDNLSNSAKIEQSRQAVEQAQLANNNDLNIATIARQVNKKPDADEVVISLH